MKRFPPFQSLLVQVSFKTPFFQRARRSGFQSLLVQVSFKTPTTETIRPASVSIPSRSGLLQNAGRTNYGPWISFNPFSFRSPSKRDQRRKGKCLSVSIPSRSGLLQNPSPEEILAEIRFNPFSFRSPSKRGNTDAYGCTTGFNPFSFRSPSKRSASMFVDAGHVSIPSRSGLLQNAVDQRSLRAKVSIPSRSGLLQNALGRCDRMEPPRFNPFSFRSPSKRCHEF